MSGSPSRAVSHYQLCGLHRAHHQLRRKLVIVGDGAAGKTSLLNVFAVGHFPENYVGGLFCSDIPAFPR